MAHSEHDWQASENSTVFHGVFAADTKRNASHPSQTMRRSSFQFQSLVLHDEKSGKANGITSDDGNFIVESQLPDIMSTSRLSRVLYIHASNVLMLLHTKME